MVSWKDFEWFGHHKLLRIIRFKAKVINDEPLMIGAGRDASIFEPAELVIVKMFDPKLNKYVPFIPGSSWKGVFRAHAVKITRSQGLNTCEGIPNNTCLKGDEFSEFEERKLDTRAKIELIMQGEIGVSGCCLLCLSFGTPGILSHITFHDSLPLKEPKLGYRTMVAISRRTGASHPRALYSVEYIEPGSEFTFSIEAINLPNYAIGLLMIIVEHMNLGLVRVGGMKTRGFGRVHFENYEFELYTLNKEYGIIDNKLKAIDPIDSDITWGEKDAVKGDEAKRVMNEFIKAWNNALPILRKISENRWRWSIIGK